MFSYVLPCSDNLISHCCYLEIWCWCNGAPQNNWPCWCSCPQDMMSQCEQIKLLWPDLTFIVWSGSAINCSLYGLPQRLLNISSTNYSGSLTNGQTCPSPHLCILNPRKLAQYNHYSVVIYILHVAMVTWLKIVVSTWSGWWMEQRPDIIQKKPFNMDPRNLIKSSWFAPRRHFGTS